MRPRLRLATTICLTICFVVLAGCVTAFLAMDRTADLLVSCMNGDAPVTTIAAGEEPPANGCWTSTEASSDPFPSAR